MAALLLLVVLALGGAGAAAAASLRGYLLERVDGQLQQAVRPFASGAPTPGADGDREGGPRLPSQFYVALLDPTGGVLAVRSNPLRGTDSAPALPRLTVNEALARSGRPFTVDPSGGAAQWRVVAAPFPDGSGSVVVAQSLSDVQQTVDQLVYLQLLIGAAVVLLLAGVAYITVRRSLRPLTEVEHTAAAIAAGDLSRRVPDRDRRTEVGRLSAALNGMLHQIEAAFRVQRASEAAARASEERMRQFVADASHELRTPLTSIRGFAELHRQGAAHPADVDRLLRRIEDEAARMGLLVDDLLLLARLDQQRPLERGLVDLLVLAADAVHDARAVAPGRPIRLEARTGTAAGVTGDESRLRQVLGNLVGNALAHTPEGTSVTVRVATRPAAAGEPPWAVLEVADKGPGLPPADAARVFERFYRADRSRSRRHGGSGLGLSIVAALTAAHGGRVELDTAVGRGATFRVLLPLAPHERGGEVTAGPPFPPTDGRPPAGVPRGADGPSARTGN